MSGGANPGKLSLEEWKRYQLELSELELSEREASNPVTSEQLQILRRLHKRLQQIAAEIALEELQPPSAIKLRLSDSASSFSAAQLVRFFPEECIAELAALYKRLVMSQQPRWLISLQMILETSGLFWAFYIQIKLENLWLPSQSGSKRVDD